MALKIKQQKMCKDLIKITLALSLSCTPKAFAWNCDDCAEMIKTHNMHLYAGVDAQMRYMGYQRGFGDKLFKKEYPQGNIYLGLRFCDYWGVEGGYETTPYRTSSPRIGAGELSTGVSYPESSVHLTKSAFDGWHIGGMGYLPTCDILCRPVEVLGYMGMVRLKTYHHDVPVLIGNTAQNIFTSNSTFNSTKSILRLGLGLQYTYCTSGFRIMVGYENTAQFNNISSQEGPMRIGNPTLKLRDSLFLSTGVFVTIP